MFISYINVTVLYYRPYWRCYYSNTDAIIYVVDSRDRDRIGISKQELCSMLEVRMSHYLKPLFRLTLFLLLLP